jgi:diguanylate cyclase (GGDEF)-like protein
MFIDLDRFKQVNDSAGHPAGDAMLRKVAQILGSQVRQTDTVARFGGDEFAILLVGCPPAQAAEIGEKTRKAVEQGVLHWEGHDHSVGASIGLVVVDEHHLTAEDVLAAADAACYAAKHGGRNALVVHGR